MVIPNFRGYFFVATKWRTGSEIGLVKVYFSRRPVAVKITPAAAPGEAPLGADGVLSNACARHDLYICILFFIKQLVFNF
jgi:hypothetical protein